MILRPLFHYQRSFKYSTARNVSFGAWQDSELAGQTGDFALLQPTGFPGPDHPSELAALEYSYLADYTGCSK